MSAMFSAMKFVTGIRFEGIFDIVQNISFHLHFSNHFTGAAILSNEWGDLNGGRRLTSRNDANDDDRILSN
jgi:hypothetical protein